MPPEPSPETPINPIDKMGPEWRRQFWRRYTGLRLMDDMMTMDRLDKQNALTRRLVRKTQDGTIGSPSGVSDDGVEEPEDDTKGFQVGDNIHYHYQQPSAPQTPSNPKPSGLPTWAKVALATAGLGAAGLGGAAVANYFSNSAGDGARYEVRLESGEQK